MPLYVGLVDVGFWGRLGLVSYRYGLCHFTWAYLTWVSVSLGYL
jgi:hypothetical protein